MTRRIAEVVVPQPAQEYRYTPYVPKPIFIRDGSDAFLKVPSRRGDELHEYSLPISMGSIT